MGARPDLEQLIFDENVPFEERALAVFRYQRGACAPYRRFCDALGVESDDVVSIDQIPFMPISVFKEVDVCTVPISEVKLRFRSSATGGVQSTHWVAEPEVYKRSILDGFKSVYGDGPFRIWSYTPSYSDNPDSSLIWMINALMDSSICSEAYRHPIGKMLDVNEIESSTSNRDPVILIGAAFGLLDLIELGIPTSLPTGSIIIETGGMKTHRRERTREELHRELSDGFGLPLTHIHSEYGMAEMLTQAYMRTRDVGLQTSERNAKRTWDVGHQTSERKAKRTWDVGHQTPERKAIRTWDVGHQTSERREEIGIREDKDNRYSRFQFPHWAQIRTTDHRSSIIDHRQDHRSLITDLANLYSCSFLISGDRIEVYDDGSFEVLGRIDPTDFRGCNFLMERD